MGNEFIIPRNIIRKIIRKTPCFSSGENFNRYPGVITEGHETNCQYSNVILYIQRGLNLKAEFYENLVLSISKIQTVRYKKYRLFIFGFGETEELQFKDKYIEISRKSIVSQKEKIIDNIKFVSSGKVSSKPVIHELFPKSQQGSNLYVRRSKINKEDLLIVLGKKGKVCFDESLESQLKASIRKHILLIVFDLSSADYIFHPKEINYCKTPKNNDMNFKRNFNDIDILTTVPPAANLFANFLKPDCEKQNVFLTIRNGYLDFYHKGGRLFKFDKKGFHTHIKYAAVIEKKGEDYLTQDKLKYYKLASDFSKSYFRIKENCANYSGLEALGVSDLYHKYSYLSENKKIVVLDIEVSFKSQEDDKKQDRIDILLFNLETKELKFVEAKHYSNKEIISTKKPDVIGQIERYKRQIKDNKPYIIPQYRNYVKILNDIFGTKLPAPEKVCKEVTILIFGFDQDQKNGRLKKLILKNKVYNGCKVFPMGNVEDIVLENLWNVKEIEQ